MLAELGPLSWTNASIGAIVGGVSHVFRDAVIHGDVAPFAPWSRDNPFFLRGSFVWVHLLCAAVGLVGLVLWHVLAERGESSDLRT
ncbi:MAG: hypothetical protein ACRELA_00925 [Candidatus Rokuibacteriota bacterium]